MLNQTIHVPQQPWRVGAVLLAYFVAALACLPSAFGDSSSVIWERGDQIVQLTKQDNDTAPPNDHPVSTTSGEIEATLETLQLRYADEDSDVASTSVFTQTEIDDLSKAVAAGLNRAAPSEDIIFHVIGTRRLGPGAFARRNRVSAGRVFYQDGDLNIIFGQVQTPYRKKNLYGQIDEDFYPRNYGSRTAATKHDVILQTNSASRLNQTSTGVRDDWIVIELNAPVVRQVDDDSSVRVPAPTTAAPVDLPEVPSTPAIPEGEEYNGEIGQADGTGTGVPVTPASADVEERLKALKRLRERELISEEAYQTKMKEILQDL